MEIRVTIGTLILVVLLPSLLFIILCTVEILVLWIVSWKLNVGLKKIKIIQAERKARALQIVAEEENGVIAQEEHVEGHESAMGQEQHEERHGNAIGQEEHEEGHENDDYLIYASVQLPTALIKQENSCNSIPEYLTILDGNEPLTSIKMTTNAAYLQFRQTPLLS